jgi:hypothetical protein
MVPDATTGAASLGETGEAEMGAIERETDWVAACCGAGAAVEGGGEAWIEAAGAAEAGSAARGAEDDGAGGCGAAGVDAGAAMTTKGAAAIVGGFDDGGAVARTSVVACALARSPRSTGCSSLETTLAGVEWAS